jgi:hypothetical protein
MDRKTGDGLSSCSISEIDLLLPIVVVACALVDFSGRGLGLSKQKK